MFSKTTSPLANEIVVSCMGGNASYHDVLIVYVDAALNTINVCDIYII